MSRSLSKESAPRDAPAPVTSDEVAAAAQLACLLEVSATKPGNVSPGRHFADARYEHFLASAAAIGAPLAAAGQRSLGATIRAAVEATSRWSASNTNLGIVLLLAPLARAAMRLGRRDASGDGSSDASGDGSGAGPRVSRDCGRDAAGAAAARLALRDAVRAVLAASSVEDAGEVYAAIRLARPGGLGQAETEDVGAEPTRPLLEVMRLAAHRDGIAREYATAFATTFEVGVPALDAARRDGLSWDDAVVETYVTLLAAGPDTHVARRSGAARAGEVTALARAAAAAGGVRSAAGRRSLADMDSALRDARNSANPGTTADLTAAAIFVMLLTGGWR